ncbi:MAG: rRNA maturation RNase YbeY [Pseudomonadota bacterium]|nr:rRNA maturation RNase YbeY [Pseudomonadota bacterium]
MVFVVQIAEGVPEQDVNAAFAQFAGPTETGLARILRGVCDHVDDSRLRREVCLRVCDAAESQALNDNFRGKDKPTNILSFPAGELAVADLTLGDLALCWPVACQEATEQHKPLHHHLAHLTVHGLLHLLDHDHEQDTEAARMEGLEIAILADLGIANPYH